jgi:hypothetical protein
MNNSLLEKLAGKTEEFEVDYNGIKILFRTLSQKDWNEIYENSTRTDIIGLELLKVPVLARAIISIDSQKFENYTEFKNQDEKIADIRKRENILENMDAVTINELFKIYGDGRENILKKKRFN